MMGMKMILIVRTRLHKISIGSNVIFFFTDVLSIQ